MKKQKLVKLDKAVEIVNSQYNVEGLSFLCKKTLYNRIWEKKLKNYGTRKCALVDLDEVLALYGRVSA